jgi:very-short-patch-repair endonuclease
MDWRTVARAQDGVITRTQLVEAGVSGMSISRIVRRGDLERLASGIYLAGAAPLSYRASLWAATLVTDGILAFATAAQLWGITNQRPQRVHVAVPHERRVYPPSWVRVHRVPAPRQVVMAREDLPTTSRAWTLLDYLPTLPRNEISRVADRAMQRGWLTLPQLEHRLRSYPGRTGNRALRRLATQLGDGAAAQSERVLHRLLRRAGIREWQANYAVWAAGELIGVVDVALPRQRVAIEVDGWAYHSDVDRFRRDRARQNDLIMLGWTVLRFTWADLTERPGYVTAAIRHVLADQGVIRPAAG